MLILFIFKKTNILQENLFEDLSQETKMFTVRAAVPNVFSKGALFEGNVSRGAPRNV